MLLCSTWCNWPTDTPASVLKTHILALASPSIHDKQRLVLEHKILVMD